MVVLPPVNEPAEYNQNYILYWNSVALDLNRLVTTLSGPLNGPPGASRVLAILHLAIHDAYFAIETSSGTPTYLSSLQNPTDPSTKLPPVLGATDARQAVAGAANTVLIQQYTTLSPNVATATTIQLTQFLQNAVSAFPDLDTLSSGYRFGVAVGNAMLNLLAIKPGEPGFDQDSYRPRPGKFRFDDDPTNPVRIVPVDINNPAGPTKAVRIYQAPFYGMTAKRVAVQGQVNGAETEHILADPPTNDLAEYYSAFDDIYREGGAQTLNTTRRTPEQTVNGLFWAYDGSNIIGTPLRLFNQIIRKVAFDNKPAGTAHEKTNADFARLFALFNASLADAGIFAWQEKYCYEFWRPLSGVREDDSPLADPFWLTLGAPATNSNQVAIKPPFPSCKHPFIQLNHSPCSPLIPLRSIRPRRLLWRGFPSRTALLQTARQPYLRARRAGQYRLRLYLRRAQRRQPRPAQPLRPQCPHYRPARHRSYSRCPQIPQSLGRYVRCRPQPRLPWSSLALRCFCLEGYTGIHYGEE